MHLMSLLYEAITSADCKEDNLEKPSDPTNPSDFPKTKTVETPVWDEEDDGWMLKAEEEDWLNQAKKNNSILVNMETQTDCWYDGMDYHVNMAYMRCLSKCSSENTLLNTLNKSLAD